MDTLVRQVAEGIHRIRLDSQAGLVVNAWLLRDGDVVALVDTGFPETVPQLEAGLAECGLCVEDLTHVFYTHSHVDHMGGGVALGQRIKAEQVAWVHPRDVFDDYVAHWAKVPSHVEAFAPRLPDTPLLRSALQELRLVHPARFPGEGKRGLAHADLRSVDPGGVVELGKWRFRAVKADGHDPGHVVWLDENTRVAFSGDVVMSVPTPIVQHMGDDLRLWLKSVERLEQESIHQLFPGHGMPTTLVKETFARSLGFLERTYTALGAELSREKSLDPLEFVAGLLGGPTLRRVPRYGIAMSNVFSLLDALASLDAVTLQGDRTWRSAGKLPTWEAFVECMRAD